MINLRKKYTNVNGVKVPLIMGGKGGCFPAGTTVSTPVGYIPIEHIGEGELVYCFDKQGNIYEAPITKIWVHNLKDTPDRIVEIEHEQGKFRVTSNHHIYSSDGKCKEAQDFIPGDCLILRDGSFSEVLSNFTVDDVDKVYNLTVDTYHTYIASDVRVSNKGGGKGGGLASPAFEDPNNLFSTDILFLTVALGEGPIYRVNSNGPQDIEINEGSIDSLLNLDTDGRTNGEVFHTNFRTGTIAQSPMPVFGDQTIVPQNLSRAVLLKKGNLDGVPQTSINQRTSLSPWSTLRFLFNINALQRMNEEGDIYGHELSVRVRIYTSLQASVPADPDPVEETEEEREEREERERRINEAKDTLNNEHASAEAVRRAEETLEQLGVEPDARLSTIVDDKNITNGVITVVRTISGKTNVPFRFTLDIPIPPSLRNASGYRFTVEKVSNDDESSKVQDLVEFIGWQEIQNLEQSYPRTALIGYALKAFAQYTGSVPTFTCMVKGLLCKVPSNYNQPILENGEVDWRQLECPDSGSLSYAVKGYQIQSSGVTVQREINPVVYQGLWDGSFTYSWTQNPVWILYDLLTNTTYGLGIPEDNIDKYRFYKVAQYCDAVDPKTGRWQGVEGFADGTFRYKPRGMFSSIRERLVGLAPGTPVRERRFICDITIGVQKQVIDLVSVIAGLFRGILFHSGGKLSLNVDLPDELPVAIFNEANILKNSLTISGIKEDDLLTGVEVTYIEPSNHHRREVVRVDDPDALREHVNIENLKQVELTGCTKRSQAIRFAQYLLASSKYIRRKITFETSSEAINLTIGEVIAVSQRAPGTAWGYGGKIKSNSVANDVHNTNIELEHFTSPGITASDFTSNTLPLGLRVIGKNTDKVDLYLLNSYFSFGSAETTVTGADTIVVSANSVYDSSSKRFISLFNRGFTTHVPTKGDLWTFGEIDPNDFYRNQSDKLYKITAIEKDEQERTTISASEYISNVYTDSDTLINYEPVVYTDIISPLIAPPAPVLSLRAITVRNLTGSLRNDIEVYSFTDTSGYPLNIETEFEYSHSDSYQIVESIIN